MALAERKDVNNFGELMREVRLSRGLTLQEVADAMEVSKPYVCRIETGNCGVSAEMAIRIAGVLGFRDDFLRAAVNDWLGNQARAVSIAWGKP